MIKKTLGYLSLLSLSFSSIAAELSSFQSITDHLSQGKGIRVVINNTKCVVQDPNERKIPISTMVMKADTLLFTQNQLSIDAVKYISSRPGLPAQHGLLQRASSLMDDQGNAVITIAFFDAETNQHFDMLQDVHINCQLGEGLHIFTTRD